MQSLTMLQGDADKIWLFAACNEASSRTIAEAGVEVGPCHFLAQLGNEWMAGAPVPGREHQCQGSTPAVAARHVAALRCPLAVHSLFTRCPLDLPETPSCCQPRLLLPAAKNALTRPRLWLWQILHITFHFAPAKGLTSRPSKL